MQCLGRRSNPNYVYFPNTTHRIYPEVRCKKETTGELCATCAARSEKAKPRLQSQPAYPHGILGQPIPPWSHIYGGPWYESMRTIHGDPAPADLKALQEARDMARRGTSEAKQSEAKTSEAKTSEAKQSDPKPRKKIVKRKAVSPAQTLTLPPPSQTPLASAPIVKPEWFESTDDVIPIESVQFVPLGKVIVNETPYWKSEEDEYFVFAPESVGPCVQVD